MNDIKVNKNERSWAITMISEINIFLRDKTWKIKQAAGEETINTGKRIMFPDLLLCSERLVSVRNILQGWEIKMPDVSITNSDFVADAQRKAEFLGLNSFMLWNFSYGVLYVKNELGYFCIEKTWDNSTLIKNRSDVEAYFQVWRSQLFEILIDIHTLIDTGKLIGKKLDLTVSETIMPKLIDYNKSLVSNCLRDAAIQDTRIETALEIWWDEVKKEYLSDELDMFDAYAKTVLLNWINRITFAHLIRKYHSPAGAIATITYDTQISQANDIFRSITAACDFYHVFASVELNEYLPSETWHTLVEYNLFLSMHSLENLDQTALQGILESSVREARREIIGQYTTPPLLAKLLVNMTVTNKTGTCLDPCCGTGTIPKEIISLKKESLNVQETYESTWAADKYAFPLQISNISLTTPDSIHIPSRIFQSDVFNLNNGLNIDIVDPKSGETMHLKLPAFDYIISNLPFVDFNTNSKDNLNFIDSLIGAVHKNTGVTLSKRNDLYLYIIFKIWELLGNGGKIGVITSNSWLGTDAGKLFFNAIRWYYNIETICISGNGKWFQNADVMSTILIMQKKNISQVNPNLRVNFIRISAPIHKWDDPDVFKVLKRTAHLSKPIDTSIASVDTYTNGEIDKLTGMNVSINTIFHHVNWLLEIENKLCKLDTLFTPFRGEKTGQDEIFYLQDSSLVDQEYIIQGLKNTRHCNTLIVKPDTDVLWCSEPLSTLESSGKSKTMNWLRRFENILNVSVKQRKGLWYDLTGSKTTKIFTGMNPGERIFFGMFESETFINQRLIGFTPIHDSIDQELCHALLNSLLGLFYVEAISFGRGQGAADFSKDNLGNMYMLNPNLIDVNQRKEILDNFAKLLSREILKTTDELNQNDRINFDTAVLRAYGIDQYYAEIKTSLLFMQSTRLSVSR